jgi:hypothetical protein
MGVSNEKASNVGKREKDMEVVMQQYNLEL